MFGNGWRSKLQGIALSAVLSVGWLSPSAALAETAELAEPAEQLYEVFSVIEQLHFSGLKGKELRDAAMYGMLLALDDPYTEYYDPASWKEMQNDFNQNYVGIGIQFIETEQGLFVRKVFSDSAAESAGLRPGDTIVGVAGITVAGKSFDELTDKLLGKEGTTVRLDVLPSGGGTPKEVLITRKPFHIPSVEYGRMEGGIGYIRITSFTEDTPETFKEALIRLGRDSLKGLIVDVRGNPGGYLESVLGIANNFIQNGPLLYTVDRNGTEGAVNIRNGSSMPMPVSVLVDGYSASASEVFAGALQDYELATVIGSQTYGKGSVQQLIPLQTGGGLRITVEHYLTPDRHEVNEIGITPDILVDGSIGQTFSAIRSLGVKSLQVRIGNYGTHVNGMEFDDIVPTVREQGKTYVPAALVAELLDGKTSWDGGTGKVSIETKPSSVSFATDAGLLLKDGKSYISLDAITRAFTSVQAKTTNQTVVLELNADG